MILDLLDPQVLDSAATVFVDLIDEELSSVKHNAESQEAAKEKGASASDGEQAKGEIEEWRKGEVEKLSGAPSGGKPPIHIPRSPVGSLLVAEMEDFFLDRFTVEPSGHGFNREEVGISPIMLSDDARRFLTDTRQRRFFPRFGQRDARFLTWGAVAKVSAWAKRGPHPFVANNQSPLGISDTARLILVGDWGSGIPRAEKVGTAMRGYVEESLRNGQDCHVIHLGDVYYCGWKREYQKRLLNSGMWPVNPGEEDRVGSWSLNGNHDMYSSGEDYFKYLLQDPRFSRRQSCSYFALENQHWQIAALDTAYADADLYGPQVAWLTGMRQRSHTKKGLLLSHHQLFSSYESCPATIENRLKPLLNDGLTRAWFWGHEHLCAAYELTAGVEYPRVVGHGGVPVYAWAGNSPTGVIWEAPDTLTDPQTGWLFARFGFAILDFQPDGSIEVRYVNENGVTRHTESLN
jgi:hypothetical protein